MEIAKRYCAHVQYAPSKYDKTSDMHIIKEHIMDKEGNVHPNIRLVENYKRPFYVSNKDTQSQHKQKREWEYLNQCDHHESTQAGLVYAVQRALGKFGQAPRLKQLLNSPYVYGCDVSAAVLIKKYEDDKNDKLSGEKWRPNLTVAVLDYETDVLHGTEKIISGSLTFNNTGYLVCTQEFADSCKGDIQKAVEERSNYHLKDLIDKGLDIKFKVVKNNLEVVKALMFTAHKLKPDFLAIWNMSFDVGKMLETLEEHNVDPGDIFCDPSVPDTYRSFNYIEDQLIKRTSSGKETPKHPADLWHKVDCLASFYIIDAMCVYKMLRAIKGNEPSYSLDAILGKELNISKLKLKEAEEYEKLAWHKFMQTNYVADYLIYNVFDCLSMELLDAKIGDIQRALGPYAGVSEYRNLRSNPRRLSDAIHFYLLEKGMVLCSTGKDMVTDLDDLVLDGNGWVNIAAPFTGNCNRKTH